MYATIGAVEEPFQTRTFRSRSLAQTGCAWEGAFWVTCRSWRSDGRSESRGMTAGGHSASSSRELASKGRLSPVPRQHET
ncbi:hypothetical protein SKAU_G00400460 [Synaphobranchus kaupii]|uniref:Uncharacterized protein n=1 Tax=Synaphobranchus kaupii TaxID=118154 RepID=A0A9Q1E8X7_SYNKA|nr:hypothetical protein SKAU_G00400460 [Synaphobranchus kaupii]